MTTLDLTALYAELDAKRDARIDRVSRNLIRRKEVASQFKDRRSHGLRARHAIKEARAKGE